MSKGSREIFEFGQFRLDASESRLARNGEVVPLSPKVFDILRVLVENSGRVMEKDELMRRVWPDTYVEDNNLTVNMSALRKALGDGAQYIETVPRRGYRFTADVRALADAPSLILTRQTVSSVTIEEVEEEVEEETAGVTEDLPATVVPQLQIAPATSRPRFARRWRGLFAAALIVAVGVAAWLALRPRAITSVSDVRSIAVLPFQSLGATDGDDSLGLGLADALITKLSNLNPLVVRPTSAIVPYAGSRRSLSEVGRELNVEALLEGRVQRDGDRLRLTVQLVRTSDGAPVWAGSFDEQVTNLFAAQTAISEKVARALTLKLTAEQQQRLAKNYTENAEAFQEYIRGRYYWNQQSPEYTKKAIAHFERAIEIDPTYALAYAGIADCYIILGTQQVLLGAAWDREHYKKAKAAALKALELDDTLAEAHTSLGAALAPEDDAAAHREWERAIELNPNYATAYSFYAIDLIGDSRLEEALEKINRAREIDPLSVAINTNRGLTLYRLRRYDEAAEQLRQAIEMNPNHMRARWGLGLTYEQQGLYDKAIAEFERCVAISNDGPLALSALAHVYAVSGRRVEAQQILARLLEMQQQGRAPAYYVAAVYVGLGDNERALSLLEQQKENLAIGLLKVDVYFDPLRDNARFTALLRRH